MTGTRTFGFSFEASTRFLLQSPVAGEYVEASKRRIAARRSAVGPRGGLYRLVSAPDEWRQDAFDAFARNVTIFTTRREGRYVRPDRIAPDLLLGDEVHFDTLTVPVVDGRVVLPDGGIVQTESAFVDFPVLTE